MRPVYIYVLKCPIDNCIRYVGQSVDPEARLKRHIKETINKKGRKTKKEAWIQHLINEKLEQNIEIFILEECTDENIDEKEIYYINLYKKTDKLTNMAEGGKSLRLRGENHPCFGKHPSPATIKKQSICKIGEKNPMFGKKNPHNEQWRNTVSKSLLNSKKLKESRSSLEYKKKLSDTKSNKTLVIDSETYEIAYTFKNCVEVAKFFNFTYANIKNARRDRRLIGKSLKQKFYIIYEKDYINIKNIIEYFIN